MPQKMGSIEAVVETIKEPFESGNFKKQEFVLRDSFTKNNGEEAYSHYKMQLVYDNIEKLQGVNVGDTVNVSFYVKGNKWMDKSNNTPKKDKNGDDIIFLNLEVQSLEVKNTVQPEAKSEESKGNTSQNQESTSDDDDQLPF